jgi:hypothetical protein
MNGLGASETVNAYDLIYGKTVYNNDQFWFTYCDIDDASNSELNDDTSRILAHNFVEESWTKYSLPVKTIGQYKNVTEWAWDNVNGTYKDSWASWDTTDDRWDSFQNQENAIINILGDKCGFLYSYEGENDQCADITAITKGETTVIKVNGTDSFRVGDRVSIDGVSGLEIDSTSIINFQDTGLSFVISEISSGNSTITINLESTDASNYTSGGIVCKLIQRSFKTKPLNPFVKEGKKCRLEKIKFFFDTDKTAMKLNLFCDRRTDPYQRDIVLDDGQNFGNAVKKWTSVRVNQIANFHTLEIHQEEGFANERLHAIQLICSPVGRLER